MPRNGFAPIILLLIISIPIAFFLIFYFPKPFPIPNLTSTQKVEILAEKIKGSKFHSPDATWWGYNMSKIVRFEDKVFTYFIDNDDSSNKTSSRFVIMKKDGENPWEEGAIFPTSRPGNLLIDSKGVLHAFVFEPFDVSVNDSIGRIIHYYFPNSPSGDIKNYKQEIIVDNDGTSETANIRIGAAIGVDDTMAISFGLTKFNPAYKEQSEHIYYKKPEEKSWNHTFKDGLDHDFYYPFTLVTKHGFHLLPIQDDFADDGNPKTYDNIYQKIIHFEYQDGKWNQEIIVDLSNHPLAKDRPRLLEQEDLYEDRDGNIHIIYKSFLHEGLSLRDKEFLDQKNDFAATVHWHVKGKLGNFKSERIKLDKAGVNWVRLVEVDKRLYYLITTFDEVYISPIDRIKLAKLDLPEDVKNNYPYIATAKGGTKPGAFIDVLLLGADQKLFREGKNTNYYLRIPKSEFTKLNNN